MADSTGSAVPQHIGLILDGNRRWAKSKGLPTLDGHRAGYENLKTIADAAHDRGVKYVSAYIFSTENWNRSKEEVSYLMDLVSLVFKRYIKELVKKKVRLHWLGTTENLSPKMIKLIEKALEQTKDFDDAHLCLCFNYGGWQELADAFNSLKADESVDIATPEVINRHLYEPSVPDVDLIIRTSGEMRLSNFMLWRAAYSEFYYADVHWPAFTPEELDKALDDYANRQRRFGK